MTDITQLAQAAKSLVLLVVKLKISTDPKVGISLAIAEQIASLGEEILHLHTQAARSNDEIIEQCAAACETLDGLLEYRSGQDPKRYGPLDCATAIRMLKWKKYE